MAVFLNLIFIFISILFFAGRLYEIINLTGGADGFITHGIVSTLPMLAALAVIAVCCGVITFAGKGAGQKIKKLPMGFFGFAAGLVFIAAGVFTVMDIFARGGFLLYPAAMILGAIGLILLGLYDIKGKSKEKIPFVLVMLLPVFTCLNNLVYDIQTIYNTVYLLKSISAIVCLLFFIFLFKSVYNSKNSTLMFLHIFALLNFAFSGASSAAHLAGYITKGGLPIGETLAYAGFLILGFYSLFISFCIIPEASAEKRRSVRRRPAENTAPAVETDGEEEDDFYRAMSAMHSAAGQSAVNYDSGEQSFTREIEKESKDSVRRFFRRLDREKAGQETSRKSDIPSAPAPETNTVYTPAQTAPSRHKSAPAESEKTVFFEKKPYTAKTKGKSAQKGKIVYKAPK